MLHFNDYNAPICTYLDRFGLAQQVRSSSINTTVKELVKALGLEANGITASMVSSHFLRAGGAMAMYLNKIDTTTIRKMGRWSSDTFLMYIHEQIGVFSKNVALKMHTHIEFNNLLGPTLVDPV